MKQWMAYQILATRFGAQHINKRAMRNVALFPKLGLAYNRIQKNANTSAMILLRELETGVIEERDIAKKESINLSCPPLWEISKLNQYKYFVIIRNPYSRVLSAFLDKFRKNKYKKRYRPFDTTPAGFNDFIGWLENGALHLNGHWNLQTNRMLLPLDQYDNVIRFENLQDDLKAFLSSRAIALNEHALADLYPSDLSKKTSASLLLHEFYTPELTNRVYVLFKKDFDNLLYLPELPT